MREVAIPNLKFQITHTLSETPPVMKITPREMIENLPTFTSKVTMFALANHTYLSRISSLEASRLQPHGKPPRCFS